MKLDAFSKILLATQSINYMAASLNGVMQSKSASASTHPIVVDSIKQDETQIYKTLQSLTVIMENLGDYINDIEAISLIDVKITAAAFDILIHGNDDMETGDLSSTFIYDENIPI